MTEKRSHLPWCRVHETWFTTRSHAELSAIALNIGPRLMSLANASPDRGALLGASGRPLTIDVLARETRFPPAAVLDALGELVSCGTLVIDADGAWRFANFLRWQEDPSSERQRRRRERDSHARSHGQVTPAVTDKSPSEDRGQRTEEEKRSPSEIHVGLKPGGTAVLTEPGLPKADPRADDIRAVFAHYRAAGHPRAFPKPSPSSREWRAIAARLAEGSTVEDLCDAIDGCHTTPHNLGHNERGEKYLGLELIVRSGSQVTRFAETKRSGGPGAGGVRKLSIAEAQLAESAAAIERMRAAQGRPRGVEIITPSGGHYTARPRSPPASLEIFTRDTTEGT